MAPGLGRERQLDSVRELLEAQSALDTGSLQVVEHVLPLGARDAQVGGQGGVGARGGLVHDGGLAGRVRPLDRGSGGNPGRVD